MTPFWQVFTGDCRHQLQGLDDQSVHTVVTSPPYFGLRDYGHDGQIGLEPSPDEFVAALVDVFREVRRVLRDDGTVWLNLGDSYAGSWGNQGRKAERGSQRPINGEMLTPALDGRYPDAGTNTGVIPAGVDYKAKDLLGIPWMVAFALRADGWYLRSEIIWAKKNCMPESVTDRPTKSHEQIFLLSKRATYHYDADAIREANDLVSLAHWQKYGERPSVAAKGNPDRADDGGNGTQASIGYNPAGRNKRSVWTVATQPYPGAHFATFPPKLIEPCVLAGCPERACSECGAPWERIVERAPDDRPTSGDTAPYLAESGRMDSGRRAKSTNGGGAEFARQRTETLGFAPSCTHDTTITPGVVLDPFAGTATTGIVALRHNRSFIGIELNPEYVELAKRRIVDDAPLFNQPAEAT